MITSGSSPWMTPCIIREEQLTKHPSRAIRRGAVRTRLRCPVFLVNAPPRQILTVFSGARVWQRMFAACRAISPRRQAPSAHHGNRFRFLAFRVIFAQTAYVLGGFDTDVLVYRFRLIIIFRSAAAWIVLVHVRSPIPFRLFRFFLRSRFASRHAALGHHLHHLLTLRTA